MHILNLILLFVLAGCVDKKEMKIFTKSGGSQGSSSSGSGSSNTITISAPTFTSANDFDRNSIG